jgi:hypothetical protein
MATRFITITEAVNQGGQRLRADREKGIIYGVKVLGERSGNPPPNDNEYPRKTREDAIGMLEGARCCVDHPARGTEEKTRPYGDSIGVHRNLRENGDGLYSDFHFNPKHPLADQLCWDAENAPNLVGFSINARGKPKRSGGRCVIEQITHVHSIDLVSRPATTKGLYESQEDDMKPKTLKQLLESKAGTPAVQKVLREMDEAMPMGMGAEVEAAPASPEEALKAGFRAAMIAVLDDESMDLQGQVGKIRDILKAKDKLMGEKPEEKDGGGSETPAEESQKPGKTDPSVKQLTEELAIRDLLEDSGIKFAKPEQRKAFIKSLVPLTESERKELIDDRKAQASQAPTAKPGAGKPRSQAPGTALSESQKTATAATDKKSFLAAIT